MYAATRQASRSASRSPATIVAGRRFAHQPRNRSFRHFAPLSQSAPAEPPKERSDEVSSEVKNTKAAPETTDVDTEAVSARKLQQARGDVRRYTTALRRQQRRKRDEDLPPIHFPKWFLDRNVTLREEFIPESSWPFMDCELIVKDNANGAVLTTLNFPCQPHTLHAALDAHGTSKAIPDLGQAFKERLEESGLMDERSSRPVEEGPSTQLQQNNNKVNINTAQSATQTTYQSPNQGQHLISPVPATSRIDPWTLAELRATIAGCLEGSRLEDELSYAAARTNLILHAHGEWSKVTDRPALPYDLILRQLVEQIGGQLGADIVRVDAQDLAEVLGDYISDGGELSPGGLRNLAFEAYKERTTGTEATEDDIEDYDEDEADMEEDAKSHENDRRPSTNYRIIRGDLPKGSNQTLLAFVKSRLENLPISEKSPVTMAPERSDNRTLYEDLKISAWIKALLDVRSNKTPTVPEDVSSGFAGPAAWIKSLFDQDANQSSEQKGTGLRDDAVHFEFNFPLDLARWRYNNALKQPSNDQQAQENEATTDITNHDAEANSHDFGFTIRLRKKNPASPNRKTDQKPRTIVLVENISEIEGTEYGARIIDKFRSVISSRKITDEHIVFIGTDWGDMSEPGKESMKRIARVQDYGADERTRTIVVPIDGGLPDTHVHNEPLFTELATGRKALDKPQYPTAPHLYGIALEQARNTEINLRQIQSVLRRLYPTAAELVDPAQPLSLPYKSASTLDIERRLLTFDECHRIALVALGLHKLDMKSERLSAVHVFQAMSIVERSDQSKFARTRKSDVQEAAAKRKESAEREAQLNSFEGRLDNIKKDATKYEKRLLTGVIDQASIRTTFSDVHAPPETIDALKTLTSLSLLRPDAFTYGVLAADKIPGLLLYGPPGTGKTLLAKAVAKESGATMLEISGSEINDMFVGEGEKNVRAVFSLARKLSPCVVFIDEADAMLQSRTSGGSGRRSDREVLNQFLREWDGMNEKSVFIMVATNRPFDLDDAVLRRLPRRLLVDLPVKEDRETILKIHLKGEDLHEGVKIDDLASKTPLYSGSDLKNLCVAAALACVKEENEQAAISASTALSSSASTSASTTDSGAPSPPAGTLVYPPKRLLQPHHFEKALQEISSSVSEDMSSLTAIRKFDEKYGDRGSKGRKKRAKWGFMTLDAEVEDKVDEKSARVRH